MGLVTFIETVGGNIHGMPSTDPAIVGWADTSKKILYTPPCFSAKHTLADAQHDQYVYICVDEEPKVYPGSETTEPRVMWGRVRVMRSNG